MFFNLFRKNPSVLCIDVGYRNIKIVEVCNKAGAEIHVKKFGLGKTPIGAISNGSIIRIDRVVQAIRKIISQQNIKAKSAKIIMSGTNIITRIYMVEKIEDEEFDTTVRGTILYNLPFLANNYHADYKILETIVADNKEISRVFITAVPHLIIQSYVKVVQQLGLKPLSIDIPGNSTAKFFSKVKDVNKYKDTRVLENTSMENNYIIYAVIDFGSETTIINFLQDGVLNFNKVILCGSSNIDEHISKDVGVNIEEAERLKIHYGLKVPNDESTEEHRMVYDSINTFVIKIVKQILNCLEFYQKNLQGLAISKVFISGGGSKLYGLNLYLQSVLKVPVYPISTLDLKGVKIDGRIEKENLIFMANSLGISM